MPVPGGLTGQTDNLDKLVDGLVNLQYENTKLQ